MMGEVKVLIRGITLKPIIVSSPAKILCSMVVVAPLFHIISVPCYLLLTYIYEASVAAT